MAMLIAVPLALSSVGYAIFTQNLSVNTSTIKPAYSSSQGLRVTYDRTVVPQGQVFTHTLNPITITNYGTAGVTAWQFKFDLPSGFSNLACTNATCTTSGNTVTMVNTGTNGTINPSGSVTVSLSFRTSLTQYTLQNVFISGTPVLTYQTMSGLTVSRTIGTRTKSGKWYAWPYTFTVTNNTGQTISAWRITANWSTTTNQVNSMDATVNYTTSATQLTITRIASLANGQNFVFNASLGSTDINWVISGLAIQGAL